MTLPICLGCSLPLQKQIVQRRQHQDISSCLHPQLRT